MSVRRSALALCTSMMLASGCATPPATPLPVAAEWVTQADEMVRTEAYAEALTTLAPLAENACPRHLRDRRDLIVAKARLGLGQPWEAFTTLQEFTSLYPHSDLRNEVVEQLWNAATMLLRRDGRVLVFWSDRSAARTVLEHLITRHPDTQLLADALIILGDMAFDTADYDLAQARYRDIILNRPESAWRFKAQFRFAMSIVGGLRGPDYDLARMEHAVRELRGFLASRTEDQKMKAEAKAALEQVQEWRMQRHVDIADYYRTLDNRTGQLHHLQMATEAQFEQTPGYDRAVERRRQVEGEVRSAPPVGGQP